MKALKEKRISLRSLWRRGLVILSLFALVFASCNSTDEEETQPTIPPTQAGPKVMSIEVVSPITANSYEGLAVDLAGLKVLVRYDNGSSNDKVIGPNDAKFVTEPPIAVGVKGYKTAGEASATWAPMKKYLLLMSTDDGPRSTEITVPDVKPIARAQSWTDTTNIDGFMYPDNSDYLWAQGLRLVGDLDQKLYVDDYPKFGNYRLQAEYVDGAVKEIPIRADTSWQIRPRYNNGPDKTGVGDLLLTIGNNPLVVKGDKTKQHPYVQAALGDLVAPTGTTANDIVFDAGLTMKHPFEEVWHVRSIKLTSPGWTTSASSTGKTTAPRPG